MSGEKIRIGVDAMGGDYGPEVVVRGAVKVMNLHSDIELVLYGMEEEINKVLNLCKPSRDIEIIDTKNNINAHYKPNPRTFMEDKKDSSMIRMLEDLKRGQIDGMFSAGNTAAYYMVSRKAGKSEGVGTTFLVSEFPNSKKPISLAGDMGGNISAQPRHMLDYALLAKSYMLERYGVDVPINLISITTEPGKGDEFDEEAFTLLEELSRIGVIKFDGYVEADSFMKGERKIVIGKARDMNMGLKGTKGGANYVLSKMPLGKYIAGLINKSGGAILLGSKYPIGKANGNSSIKTISISLSELYDFMKENKSNNLIQKVADRYLKFKEESLKKEEA